MSMARLPAAAVLAALLAGGVLSQPVPADESCGEFGTSVEFSDSPAEAAKQAIEEEKLLFVLHVSGHFEESEYT